MTTDTPPPLPAALREPDAGLGAIRYRTVVTSAALAAGAYLVFIFLSGWADVSAAVARVGLVGVIVALLLSLLNYLLRFGRWQMYLQALGHPVPAWPSLKVYLAGFALTTTPGKAGEMLRGVVLKRWGMPYARSVAAFLSERLSDLLAIMLLALLGLSLYPAAAPLMGAGAVLVLIVFGAILWRGAVDRLASAVERSGRLRWLRHFFAILAQARHCHGPALFAAATALSLVAWGAEAWAFYLVLAWMDLDVSLRFAVFVYAISMLAGALSFMPGGLGGAEAVMVGLLVWSGAGTAEAVGATVLIRVATLWFAVVLGLLALVLVGKPAPEAA